MDIRIPLVGQPNQRLSSGTKDQRFINCYAEVVTNPVVGDPKIYLVKRPGLTAVQTTTGATGEARGVYFWDGNYYSVYGDKVYRNTTAIQTLSTSTGRVGFTETTGATNYLFFCDGTNAYVTTTAGAVTQVVDPDLPTPHIPVPVYMDGYVFLVKSTTNEIYNSNLEDPLNWLATNFIQAEMYPDSIVSIGRQNNQLVAFGSQTVEFFYDAGNPTGSPLARTDQYVQQQGLAARDSLDQAEGILTWVSQSAAGQRYIVAMEGFTPKKISNEPIDRLLNSDNNLTSGIGNIVRVGGHLMYIMTTTNRSYVYDFNTQIWLQFESSNLGYFIGRWAAEASGTAVWQVSNNNKLYNFSVDSFNDDVYDFTVDIRTTKIDVGTMKWKHLSRVEVIADWQDTAVNPVTVEVSDDDYLTWKQSRSLSLTKRMVAWRWGQFRRRAFRLRYTGNTAFRAEALELTLDVGTT